jgi:hypothetical protein
MQAFRRARYGLHSLSRLRFTVRGIAFAISQMEQGAPSGIA